MSAMSRFLLLCAFLQSGAAPAADYEVDPTASRIIVHVGKSGVFGFAGHTHEVAGHVHAGRVHAEAGDLSRSSVAVEMNARDFHVVADKEPEGDAPKVQAKMERDVLEVERHPDIAFTSTSVQGREVSPGRYALELTGTLALHGMEKRLTIPVDVHVGGGSLTAKGRLAITHDAFGLQRVSAGAGTVRVANDLAIDFTLVAHEATP
jgi:polyisoprenoid-binding protein YceI